MRLRKIILIGVLMLGMIFPFIDFLVVVEAFYLLIPLLFALVASVAMLIKYLIWDRVRSRESLLLILVVPVFVAGHFFSTWTVDNIQRFRSEGVIMEIENVISETGQIPNEHETTFGIKFSKLKNADEFEIRYCRGFMVTEIYSSKDKMWRSQGWND
jgi:hypothetical protein